MIKTALKHWILEACIEQVFKAINKNFIGTPRQFERGEFYAYIIKTFVSWDAELDRIATSLFKYNNVKFLIVGKGHSPYKKKLRNLVKKAKLEGYFIFLGFVKDRNYYYRKSSIFVMPSVSEPFGITPLEAISNGTPAIISKQSGVAELLKNCIKINYWDTDKLAKNILFLLRNKKAYNKLRRDGLKNHLSPSPFQRVLNAKHR